MTSESLLSRLQRKEADALGEYIESHRPRLLAFIDRQLGANLRKKIEPADILQELSVHALRALPEADLVNHDPFNWLCHLAEQRIIDVHRRFGSQKRAAEREVPLEGPADTSSPGGFLNQLIVSMTSPSQAFSRDQREIRLRNALMTLPEESREAIRLRYVEGLPTKEIARRLSKTDGAIRVLLTRSLKRLQELLKE